MKLGNRIVSYLLGVFLLALGVVFSVNSNLGVSPVNSLPYAVSAVSGIKMGTTVIFIYATYIFIQFLILRKDFKPIYVLQLVISIIYGKFLDWTKLLLGEFSLPTYFGQLGMLVISIVLVGLGLVFYVEADLMPMPVEGMAKAIAQKSGMQFPNVKVMVDCLSAFTAILVTWIGLGYIDGVREGTIISALLCGKAMQLFSKTFMKPFIQKFLRPNPPQDAGSAPEQPAESEQPDAIS